MSADYDVVSGDDQQAVASSTVDPLAYIAKQIEEAKKQEDEPVKITDIFAAAITALETCVAILGGPRTENGKAVIEAYEERARTYAENMVDE